MSRWGSLSLARAAKLKCQCVSRATGALGLSVLCVGATAVTLWFNAILNETRSAPHADARVVEAVVSPGSGSCMLRFGGRFPKADDQPTEINFWDWVLPPAKCVHACPSPTWHSFRGQLAIVRSPDASQMSAFIMFAVKEGRTKRSLTHNVILESDSQEIELKMRAARDVRQLTSNDTTRVKGIVDRIVSTRRFIVRASDKDQYRAIVSVNLGTEPVAAIELGERFTSCVREQMDFGQE